MNPYEILAAQMDLIHEALGKERASRPVSFEEFLQEKHMEDYTGTDDDAPDAYEHWISNLDTQEVMDYAEEWGATLYKV